MTYDVLSYAGARHRATVGPVARTIHLALAQYPPVTGADPIGRLRRQAAELAAAQPRPTMLVFPEIHLCGDADTAADPDAWLAAAAEPLDGPRVAALGRIAAELGVWLIPGTLPERAADGRLHNTAVVFDPSGALVASYRKVFPWRPFEKWDPGHEFVVFDLPGIGRGGLTICYDAWFPEATRSVAWMGAEFVVNLVKTVGDDRPQERLLARANAIVNQVFVLSVNAAAPIGVGGSLVADPEGEVIADAPGADPQVLSVALDLDAVTRVRRHGTKGTNRLWAQTRPGDPDIDLPIYQGRIAPDRWSPRTAAQ